MDETPNPGTSGSRTTQEAVYEGAHSPLPLLNSFRGTIAAPIATSLPLSSPNNEHPAENASLDSWNHARRTLNTPQYYYTTIRANTPYKHLLGPEREVFTLRNHRLTLAIEQILSDFRIQLRGCLIWQDDEMLTEVWKRLMEAREGMVMLKQPEGQSKVKGH